jgi:hypothetical protein
MDKKCEVRAVERLPFGGLFVTGVYQRFIRASETIVVQRWPRVQILSPRPRISN